MLLNLSCTIVPWAFAILAGAVLLRRARENRNPLEWPQVDRCLIILTLFCVAGGLENLSTILETAGDSGIPSHINPDFLHHYFMLNRIVGSALILMMIAGFASRDRISGRQWFAASIILSNAVVMALICYAKGSVSHPGPILLAMSFGTLCLLLFRPALSLTWIAAFCAVVLASTVLTWLGWLPYAPFYTASPFAGGQVDDVFLLGRTLVILAFYLLTLAVVAYIFLRWRDRETQLAHYTSFLKKLFGRYLSESVMNALIENPAAMKMGGERRRVAIMMTDIRGFTALSERLSPEQVVQMLNTYFEIMVDVILSYNGTVNEIIGDALLVIFGAPQEMPDRIEQSIACAVTMQNRMRDVNRQNRAQGLPALEMGIGLNEDEVIVGNIGSSRRIKYGVVGSGVNMTGRIESYTVGGQILISENMRRKAGDLLCIDGRRKVFPKGADTPLTLYEVGGIAGTYNLSLEREDPSPSPIPRKIPVTCAVIGGKHVENRELTGDLVRLSRRNARVALDRDLNRDLALWTNLKLNLADPPDELIQKDFYAKIVEKTGDGSFLVRFTAVPPEIAAYFSAFLALSP